MRLFILCNVSTKKEKHAHISIYLVHVITIVGTKQTKRNTAKICEGKKRAGKKHQNLNV